MDQHGHRSRRHQRRQLHVDGLLHPQIFRRLLHQGHVGQLELRRAADPPGDDLPGLCRSGHPLEGRHPRGLQPDERAACPFVHGPHPAGRADQQGVAARLHPARTPRRALPRKEPLLLDAVLPRTDQPRRTGQGCPVEFDPGDERPEGTVVFRQIRRLPQDAAPHLRHAPRGRPQRQDIGGRQNLPHGALLEGEPRIPREALPLPDPDRRVAAGQHSAKPQLLFDNHRPDRPNRRSG